MRTYTPDLDPLHADTLAAADGADMVLRHLSPGGVATDSIDGRYAPFDASATTRTKLRDLLDKGVRRLIGLDDRVYRLAGASAEKGFLIVAPAGLDFPARFALAPNPTSITLGKDGGFGSGPDTFTVEFFIVAVRR